jgi:hypothetical protein
MYQVQVVPDQNREIEFKHNERVQDQLLDVRSAIMTTAGGGGSRSVSVTLGTRYPSRTIFLNPSPPYGRLRTVGTTNRSVNITIANAKATNPETADFWDGTNRSYSTGALVYEPFYHRYDNAPSTVYEHSLLANRFDGATLAQTDQALVDGNEITIVTLNGSLQESGTDGVSVDTEDLSVSTQTIRITNTSGNITLRIPTLLEESVWNESLAGAENVVEPITYRSRPDRRFNVLEVTLKPGNYTLNMAKVGIGSETEQPSDTANYITTELKTSRSVQTGGTVDLSVQVNDFFNNPVSSKTVTVEPAGAVSPSTGETNREGEFPFTYEAPDTPGTYTVTARVDGGGEATQRVEFTITVEATSAGGGSSGAYSITWQDPSGKSGVEEPCNADDCVWNVSKDGDTSLDLTVKTSPTVENLNSEFSVNDSSVAYISSSESDTGSDGVANATLTASRNGTVKAYVITGDSSDAINVTVKNVGVGNQPPEIRKFKVSSGKCGEGEADKKYCAEWNATDADGNIVNATVALKDKKDNTIDSKSYAYGNASTVSESTQLSYGGNDDPQYVLIIVHDSKSAKDEETKSV